MSQESPIPPGQVAELIRIARDHGLSEMVVQQGSARVEIRLASPGTAEDTGTPGAAPAAPPGKQPAVIHIPSPVTGIFYPTPSPTDPPFVSPGDIVREGDPIGLIEAMKVFNEVLADRSGRVRRVIPTSGQLVQQGDPLVELAPLDHGEV